MDIVQLVVSELSEIVVVSELVMFSVGLESSELLLGSGVSLLVSVLTVIHRHNITVRRKKILLLDGYIIVLLVIFYLFCSYYWKYILFI